MRPPYFTILYVLLFIFVPSLLTGYFFGALILLFVVPVGVIVAFLTAGMVADLIWPPKKVSSEEFADALEKHLRGEGGYEYIDSLARMVPVDQRLKPIQWDLYRFDPIQSENDREELRRIIEAIRRGTLPEFVPATQITYLKR